MSEAAATPAPPRTWGWLASLGGIAGFLLLGEGVASVGRRLASGSAGVLAWGSALVFLVSAGVFLALHGRGVLAFLRSVRVGALTIALYAVASCLGVLLKQEDLRAPAPRSPAEKEEFFQKFAYAQTYFVYHLLRPFGIGMPAVEIPPNAAQGIEWRASRYGREAAEAQRKQMRAALSAREKDAEIGKWIEAYEPSLRGLFAFCQAVDLTRVWKSDWFAALNALLATCVFSNWFRFGWRAWFTVRRFGFFLAHLGVLVLFAGCLAGRLFERRGQVHLSTNPAHPQGIPNASRAFRPFLDPAHPLEMPFTLRLEEFKAEYRTYLRAFFLDEEAQRHANVAPPEHLVRAGAVFLFDFDDEGRPRIRIRVKALYPRCDVRPDLVPSAEGGGPAMAAYAFRPEPPHLEEGVDPHEHAPIHWYLAADREDSLFLHPENAYRLRLLRVSDAQGAVQALAAPVEESPGRLALEVGPAEAPARKEGEASVGSTLSLSIPTSGDNPREVAATVLSYVPDFRLERDPVTGRSVRAADPTPIERQVPRNPALEVEVRSGEAKETRWIFAHFDVEEVDPSHRFRWKIPDVKVKFRWDAWTSPVPARHLLLLRDDGVLLVGKAGEPDSAREARLGEALPLESSGSLAVTEAERHVARIAPDLRPLDEGDFFHREASACVLEVEGPEGTETYPLAARDGFDKAVYAGRLGIRYYENRGGMPREWRSRLGAYDDQGSRIAGGEIRVNDYLDVKGYKFFQENANAEDPTYSGIGVVFDPGIPLVLLGLYTIIAGAAYAFFVRPILLRKRGGA